MTQVFILEDGTRRELQAGDFGAKLDERLGNRVRGLGAPPPTQMIVIPDGLLSDEEVVAFAIEEKRTMAWRIALVRRLAQIAADQVAGWTLGALDWVGGQLGDALMRIQEKVHRYRYPEMRNVWSEDDTVVLQERSTSVS